jgi:hypothetical protein
MKSMSKAASHGRKINLLVEDSGYDPKKAVLAAQKLVNQNKIFMMVGHLGTAQNLAAMPVQFEKNVINFFPVTAAREMYEPFHKLKYAFAATYLRPDESCSTQAGEGKEGPRKSAPCTRTMSSAWKCNAAQKTASSPWA